MAAETSGLLSSLCTSASKQKEPYVLLRQKYHVLASTHTKLSHDRSWASWLLLTQLAMHSQAEQGKKRKTIIKGVQDPCWDLSTVNSWFSGLWVRNRVKHRVKSGALEQNDPRIDSLVRHLHPDTNFNTFWQISHPWNQDDKTSSIIRTISK